MLRLIALRGERAHENVEHSQRKENVIYRDRRRMIERYTTIGKKTKKKNMQTNLETQQNRMYS